MISTVVGSYPVYKNGSKSFKNKISSIFGTYDPCKIAIAHAVESQLNAGIDLISDGQVRCEMIEMFAKSIPGFKIENNAFLINSKIRSHHKSIGANDLKLAIKYMNDFLVKSDMPKEEKTKKGLKGIVTGPCTMIQSSRLGSVYKDKNMAILDIANVLKDESISLENAGAKLLQIDEPFISTGLIDMKVAKEAIDLIADEINIPVAIHTCGNLKNVFKDMITFNVDIIDCEFAGHPNNISVLEKYSNELNGKKIGLGVVDTKKPTVDSVKDMAKIIEKGITIVGKENLYIDPDCGMRLLSDKTAFLKLKNMVESIKLFN